MYSDPGVYISDAFGQEFFVRILYMQQDVKNPTGSLFTEIRLIRFLSLRSDAHIFVFQILFFLFPWHFLILKYVC